MALNRNLVVSLPENLVHVAGRGGSIDMGCAAFENVTFGDDLASDGVPSGLDLRRRLHGSERFGTDCARTEAAALMAGGASAVPDGVEVVYYENALICAGFIDTHIHFVQTGILGAFAAQLIDWLNTYLYAVTPRFAPTSTPEQLELAGTLWGETPGPFMHTHVSENVSEISWFRSLFPNRAGYLDVYDHDGPASATSGDPAIAAT